MSFLTIASNFLTVIFKVSQPIYANGRLPQQEGVRVSTTAGFQQRHNTEIIAVVEVTNVLTGGSRSYYIPPFGRIWSCHK